MEVTFLICKCPNCGKALVYSIENKSLTCPSCNSTFSPSGTIEEELYSQLESMECDIYKCTTCGAELTINDVEAATFCGYCGQPTIVFNRVSSWAKPEKIIPFSITRDEAERAIRKYLRKSIFTKRKLRNFKTERICGIYVPFWLYDMDYRSQQTLKGTEGHGKDARTYYYFRECECSFSNLTVDASKRLDNRSSQRLEPYDFSDVKDFDIGYLSGFYADRYDVTSEYGKYDATYNARELYNEEVIKTIPAHSVSITADSPTYKINSVTYALLPVWFLSFLDDKKKCYTIMVNGQTGKVVGALPYVKARIIIPTLVSGGLLSIASFKFVETLLTGDDISQTFEVLIALIAAIVAIFKFGIKYWDKIRTSIYLTTASDINKYAKERQEE